MHIQAENYELYNLRTPMFSFIFGIVQYKYKG